MRNPNLSHKKVSIIGAARSGVAAALLLQRVGAIPFVSDVSSPAQLSEYLPKLQAMNVLYESGGHTEKVYDAELVIVSPGVPANAGVLMEAKKRGMNIISEIEFASWFCASPICAITGTNGKTTTTALLGKMFSDAGRETFIGGNIGSPFSGFVLQTTPSSVVVLEVSSYQLDFCVEFHPFISILTNITPDHLDRYEHTMENYVASKARVFMNQTSTDYLIFNADDSRTAHLAKKSNAATVGFSSSTTVSNGAFIEGDSLATTLHGVTSGIIALKEIKIPGNHNVENAMAAALAAQLMNVSTGSISNTLRTFPGVEHRIEFVRELDGVQYYNDSKATNVESVEKALQAFHLKGNKIILLLGGEDHGNDYAAIVPLVKENVRSIVAIGDSADKVFYNFHSLVDVDIVSTMKDAVHTAKEKSLRGDIVLLSPACKSFDWFKNYEHRGNVFKEMVNNL